LFANFVQMKKQIYLLVVLGLLISCAPNTKGDMVVNGTVKNLRKGTLYLQKMKDTMLVSVDSVHLEGTNTFSLSDQIESPEVYFIQLNKSPEKRVFFFGEKGDIGVTTSLEKFATSVKITGSDNQVLWEQHQKMLQKFNNKQLDFFKARFEAQKANDAGLLTDIEEKERRLIRSKYLYATNFAISHSDTELAPYIALTDLRYATIQLLDTVNNSLSTRVKASKYGQELDAFIKRIRSNEP